VAPNTFGESGKLVDEITAQERQIAATFDQTNAQRAEASKNVAISGAPIRSLANSGGLMTKARQTRSQARHASNRATLSSSRKSLRNQTSPTFTVSLDGLE
jgi:methylthioribose-1-phosphate isomerase